MQREFAAFTTDDGGNKICQRCKDQCDELFFLESDEAGQSGKFICYGCRKRYRDLGLSSRRDDDSTQSSDAQSLVNNIRASNINAQRGNKANNPFRSLGEASSRPHQPQMPMAPPPVPAQGRHGTPNFTVPVPPAFLQGRSGPTSGNFHGPSRGPLIYTPPNHSSASFSSIFPKMSANPGYQEAHGRYEAIRNYFQGKAYSQGNLQTITLRCWLARLEPAKQKQSLISDIYVAIPNIPVNVGAADLKFIVYHGLLPSIIPWLRGYPIDNIEFTLRKEHWIEIIPSAPDINAIADQFFVMKQSRTGGGATRTFNNKNPAKLYLGMKNTTYDNIIEHHYQLDNPETEEFSGDTSSKAAVTRGSKKGKAKATLSIVERGRRGHKKTTKIESEDFPTSVDPEKTTIGGPDYDEYPARHRHDASTPPPASKNQKAIEEPNAAYTTTGKLYEKDATQASRRRRDTSTPPPAPKKHKLMESPDAAHIKKALMQQVAPKSKAMKGLFDNTSRNFLIHLLPVTTWAEAISNPQIFSDLKKIPPRHEVIYYNVKSQPSFGGFKSAFPGKVGKPIFASNSEDICMKQGFYTNTAEEHKVLYQPASQLSFLGGELNLLGWGTTMMDMVYRYMEMQEKTLGKPPFSVPVMRFVNAGLAIDQTDPGKNAFLVEEWIDEKTNGPFVKYIHNRSGRPNKFDQFEYALRASFLSFCQHVQFYKTDKAAYVSDFQGGLMLLTDPQIISDPYAGDPFLFQVDMLTTIIISDMGFSRIFGDGNTNYGALEQDHECTEFCEFYRVPKEVFDTSCKEAAPRSSAPPLRSLSPTASDVFPLPGLHLVKATQKEGRSRSKNKSKKNDGPGPSSVTIDLTADGLYH